MAFQATMESGAHVELARHGILIVSATTATVSQRGKLGRACDLQGDISKFREILLARVPV